MPGLYHHVFTFLTFLIVFPNQGVFPTSDVEGWGWEGQDCGMPLVAASALLFTVALVCAIF